MGKREMEKRKYVDGKRDVTTRQMVNSDVSSENVIPVNSRESTSFLQADVDHPSFKDIEFDLDKLARIASSTVGKTAYLAGDRNDLTTNQENHISILESSFRMRFKFDHGD